MARLLAGFIAPSLPIRDAFCRYNTDLPLRLSELAILVTAARWKSQAEWYIHYPIAIDAGMSEDVAEAIRTGSTPKCDDPDEEVVYAFAIELYEDKRVSDVRRCWALMSTSSPVKKATPPHSWT